MDDHEHDLNVGDDHAFSLLHWAAKGGHVAIAEMLLSRGARVNSTNMGDDTSLHLAAAHGHRQIVVKLLSRKADVNATNEHGMTPLHYACFWGYEQIAEVILLINSNRACLELQNKYKLDWENFLGKLEKNDFSKNSENFFSKFSNKFFSESFNFAMKMYSLGEIIFIIKYN